MFLWLVYVFALGETQRQLLAPFFLSCSSLKWVKDVHYEQNCFPVYFWKRLYLSYLFLKDLRTLSSQTTQNHCYSLGQILDGRINFSEGYGSIQVFCFLLSQLGNCYIYFFFLKNCHKQEIKKKITRHFAGLVGIN